MIDSIKDVLTKTAPMQDQWRETRVGPTRWSTDLLRPNNGLANPIGALLNYQYLAGRQTYAPGELYAKRIEAYDFGQALSDQTSDTIDDFISLNPKYSVITKQCIAATFAAAMFETDKHGGRVYPKKFGARLSADGKTRNWIHLLINIARHHLRATPSAEKIKIISFNYDRGRRIPTPAE